MTDPVSSPSTTYRSWRYAEIGDYHRQFDQNNPYYPSYKAKMQLVRQWLESLPPDWRILDAGCGEGLVVEFLQNQGRQAEGLDLNYASQFVRQGSVQNMPYPDQSFDVVLLLDVLEHVAWSQQSTVLQEVARILKPQGLFCISVPNLAHLSSRLRFLLRGHYIRTDDEAEHVGERPVSEFIWLLKQQPFKLVQRQGITLTVPFIYESLICKRPKELCWLHDLLQPVALPGLAMYNLMIWRRI